MGYRQLSSCAININSEDVRLCFSIYKLHLFIYFIYGYIELFFVYKKLVAFNSYKKCVQNNKTYLFRRLNYPRNCNPNALLVLCYAYNKRKNCNCLALNRNLINVPIHLIEFNFMKIVNSSIFH